MADYRLMRVCISGHYTEFFTQLVNQHRPGTAAATMELLYANEFVYPPSFRHEMAERGVRGRRGVFRLPSAPEDVSPGSGPSFQ